MSGQLRTATDDGPVRCALCGALAVGPCASCRAPVCGDCCTLTQGGVNTYAVCLRCAKKGTSLLGGWLTLLGWIALPLAALLAFGVLLGWLGGCLRVGL